MANRKERKKSSLKTCAPAIRPVACCRLPTKLGTFEVGHVFGRFHHRLYGSFEVPEPQGFPVHVIEETLVSDRLDTWVCGVCGFVGLWVCGFVGVVGVVGLWVWVCLWVLWVLWCCCGGVVVVVWWCGGVVGLGV